MLPLEMHPINKIILSPTLNPSACRVGFILAIAKIRYRFLGTGKMFFVRIEIVFLIQGYQFMNDAL
jgi:hypothetical protein